MELRKKSSGTAGTQGGDMANLHMNVDTTRNVMYISANNMTTSILTAPNVSSFFGNNISISIQITNP